MKPFRAMGSTKPDDWSDIRWPMLASPKVNGIRCIVHPRLGPITRKNEDIPNVFVRSQLRKLFRYEPNSIFDGELVVGDEADPSTWNRTQSGIMSEEGRPDFKYLLFDWLIEKDTPYRSRYARLPGIVKDLRHRLGIEWLHYLPHKLLRSVDELKEIEADCVAIGYEGVMLRSLNGPYKEGRATLKEGWLLKIKRVKDHEAVIVGFEEMMHNANEATTSKTGHTKRSGHKANKVGKNTLGKFIVTATFDQPGQLVTAPVQFNIGTGKGLTHELRAKIWANRSKWRGRTILFKYQDLSPDGKPIFPIYLGVRKD